MFSDNRHLMTRVCYCATALGIASVLAWRYATPSKPPDLVIINGGFGEYRATSDGMFVNQAIGWRDSLTVGIATTVLTACVFVALVMSVRRLTQFTFHERSVTLLFTFALMGLTQGLLLAGVGILRPPAALPQQLRISQSIGSDLQGQPQIDIGPNALSFAIVGLAIGAMCGLVANVVTRSGQRYQSS